MAKLNCDMCVIPGGCTGLIQAPDVSWNGPFKRRMQEQFDTWIAGNNQTFTAAGNIRVASQVEVATWVKNAWADISIDLLQKSLNCSAITLPNDGSRDDEISCFKECRPAEGGLRILNERMANLHNEMQEEADPFDTDDSDEVD